MSLPKYDHYKPSGVEWLGDVPAHWDVVPLKYLVSMRSGGTPDKSNTEYWDGLVPWASAKDLKVDELWDTADHITDDAVSCGAATLVPVGAVLVVVRGMILARLFPVVVAKVQMAINQDLKAVISGDRLNSGFLAWLLRGSSGESLSRLDEAGHGTKALRMDSWSAMQLPVPALQEQSAIAHFLDHETSKIDALIAEQAKLIALLAEKRQATISHAVTRGLDPAAPMKDSGVAWLGEVPAHWRLPPLYMRYSADLGKMLDASKITGDFLLPYLRNVDVQWDRINFEDLPEMDITPAEEKRYTVQNGDLLVCEGGEVGRAAVVAGVEHIYAYQKALHRLRPLSNQEIPRFMFYTLLWASKAGAFSGEGQSTIAHLTGEQLRKYRFPTPSQVEQEAIVNFLDEELRHIDGLTAEAERAIALLKERRAALIAAAVTGQIDVRGWRMN